MDNQGYQSGAEPPPGYQQDTPDDTLPANPENPMHFEGYSSIGVCSLKQGSRKNIQT